ncbi:MAG: hypothetical protein IJO52_01750, partial [Clostridia bacterium]|nr:hypothetical protein [Clostridia bacterium]
FVIAAMFTVVTSLSIISLLKLLLFIMMFFNLPNLFNERTKNKTVITKKKIIVLAIVVAVVLCVYAVADDAIHGDRNDSNQSKITCGSCGRSFEAGDSSKNYINIAESGLCNNCESNYHSMKQFLD